MFQECAKTVPGEEDGNTESSSSQSNPIYKWDFVLNNYTEEEVCQINTTLEKYCKEAGYSFEIGSEKQTPHLQGYLTLKKKLRLTGLKKIFGPRVSFRPTRNEEALKAYCAKTNGKLDWQFPKPKKPLKLITPDKWWQLELLELLDTEPDDRKVHWYWSHAGSIGKSQFAKYCVAKKNCLFFEEGKKADIMHLIFEAPDERLERIFIDVPRDNGNNISYKAIESIKNGMIYSPKYEGGYKLFNSPHIIIFANEPPQEHRLSADRWIIKQIDDLKVIDDENNM